MQRSIASLATLALGLLGTAAHAAPPTPGPAVAGAAATSPVHAVKVTILSTMLAEEGIGEWGFAALVEVDGKKILYDTGARARTVLDNARELHVELGDVEDVILSHFHDDHTTGLATLRLAQPSISTMAFAPGRSHSSVRRRSSRCNICDPL